MFYYNIMFVSVLCPGSLMDKVMDSGSIDAGSIPVRGTKSLLREVDCRCKRLLCGAPSMGAI